MSELNRNGGSAINNRFDIVYFFEITDGNPNGSSPTSA